MAEEICNLCNRVWDTRESKECPRCTEGRKADEQQIRARKLGFGRGKDSNRETDEQQDVSFVQAVPMKADLVDSRAISLANMTNLVSSLGILGSVILGIMGIAAESGANGLVIAASLAGVAFWLLVRAFGMAFAARLELAAMLARLQASRDPDFT